MAQFAQRIAEGKQANQHSDRPHYEREDERYRYAGNCRLHEFRRSDEQPQQQEHRLLRQPSHRVMDAPDAARVWDSPRSHHDSTDVGAEQSTPVDQRRQSER
jgi:hypothetical protein